MSRLLSILRHGIRHALPRKPFPWLCGAGLIPAKLTLAVTLAAPAPRDVPAPRPETGALFRLPRGESDCAHGAAKASPRLPARVSGAQDLTVSLTAFRRLFGHESRASWPRFCFVSADGKWARRLDSVRDADEDEKTLRLFSEGPLVDD